MGSTDKLLKGGLQASVNPIKGTKTSLSAAKTDYGDFSGKTRAKKAAKDAAAIAEEQRAEQRTQLAKLDDEENRRIKKILAGGRGTRSYRGGPMFRTRAGDRAGSPRTAAGTGSSALNAEALREGGARGGKRDTYSSLLQ